MIMINESAPEHRGAVNGIGQSFAALARSIGPAAGGMLFSWSIQNSFFPFNYWFVFVLLSIFSILTVIATIAISRKQPYSLMTEKNDDVNASFPEN